MSVAMKPSPDRHEFHTRRGFWNIVAAARYADIRPSEIVAADGDAHAANREQEQPRRRARCGARKARRKSTIE